MSQNPAKKVKKRLAPAQAGSPAKARAVAAPAADDLTLKADVQAFASQLGLAVPSGDASGFDDRDFRPEAASRKLGDGKKRAKPSTGGAPDSIQKGGLPAVKDGKARESAATKVYGKKAARPDQAQRAGDRHGGEGRPMPGSSQGGRPSQGPQAEAASKGRNWNAGVGPRPGVLLRYD